MQPQQPPAPGPWPPAPPQQQWGPPPPYQPPMPPPAPKRKSRAPLVLAVIGALVAVGIVAAVLDGGEEPAAAPRASAKAAPDYEVVKTRKDGVDLLVQDATVATARAAITDWIEKNAGDRDYLTVMVVRSAAARTYVCQGEYVADERTSQLKTGGRVTADSYPTTAMNCPDPH
ncbi:hypothetical protein Ssi03_25790 [Sphaerisporangium siamense]|uniref:Phenylpyruvate tautomerase PptA (4-oxalocrotonate tautomerase family) n=1 Tax=Sphaerisporangium siamense TaxID=795645 RepID=A0A7W7D4D3_9ACTN|nr:hypothetical protein [Sphaerisporangium siamense]MBB4700094.1 phenylpyruvate tautomerase PptA (4-oxalocrotonate tautomerase family) [Sphaerisporangium siamense]GII84589.1 hypothetical protein Ssi03_25790 [Sphaerisporangium siamense]